MEVEGKKITEPTEELAPVPSGVSCSPTLNKGCRALTFNYATSTTATGETPSQWGDYNGRLARVYFTAWDPSKKEMTTSTPAQYAYDTQGRLRAEWDPLISPALKTDYGYDSEGHLTAITPPGQESWALTYGTTGGDLNTGRLLKAMRPSATTSLWSGEAPKNMEVPKLTGTALPGVRMAVSAGAWASAPVTYGYQWKDCNKEGKECTTIAGATNPNYTPVESDVGHTLVAQVIADNGGGSVAASSAPSARVGAAEEYVLPSGSDPYGIAPGSDGNVWFTELAKSKIGKITTSGTITEYSGTTLPTKIAAGPDKNLWYTDLLTSKIGKITTSGTVSQYSLPEGSYPWGITAGPDENLWFAESGTSKIGKITTSGTITEYSLPSGSGPSGIASGSDGNLWFTECGSNKIGKTTTSGTITEYSLPSGSEPEDITAGSDKNLWFTERKSNKIGKITTAGTVTEYSLPSGSEPEDITAGSDKNLWFTERKSNKIGKITTAGTVSEYALPAGTTPEAITSGPDGKVWFTGQGSGTIGKINPSPPAPTEGEQRGPSAGWTIEYNVPVSGSGAPYTLGATEEEAWGQKDAPSEATAVFPPDEPQGWPASNYNRASIEYFDTRDRVVNTATPGGAISTTEHNETNDVVRTLSPGNRAAALKEGSKSAEVSKQLDSESTYNSEGTELLSGLGPQHSVKLSNGTQVQARQTTRYYYDEGAPSEGGPYNLVTKTTTAALVSGKEEDLHTTLTSYSGEENLGWRLRKPTSTTTDPSGLKLVHTVFYDQQSGDVIETRTPAGGSGGTQAEGYAYTAQYSRITETCTPTTMKSPDGVAFDSSGNVWIADTGNDRVVELTSAGKYVTQFGSEGAGNGQFKEPRGLAIDSSGHVWVADTGNNRVQELSSKGEFILAFGIEGTANGQFKKPLGVAVNSEGNVWVADHVNNRIEEFSSTGTYITKATVLVEPEGITVDSKKDVWVTASNTVYDYSPTGEKLIGSFGATGSGNGAFKEAAGLAISGEDLYVADRGNSRIQEFKVTETEGKLSHEYLTQFGSNGSGNGQFKEPQDVALDKESHAWVADAGNNRIQELSGTGTYIAQYSKVTETCTPVTMKSPAGVAFDSSGNVWIADTGHNRVDELTSAGKCVTRFGTEGTGNGQFKEPRGLAIDSSGHVWVADTGNNRVQELSSKGEFILAFGIEGTANGQFKKPLGVAVNSEGDVWVADTGNRRIQEFSSTGAYIRQAAVGEGVIEPQGITVDSKGDVWVTGGNLVWDYSPTAEKLIGDLGGGGSEGVQLKEAIGLAISGEHLFVVDRGNSRVVEYKVSEKEGKLSQEYLTQFGTSGSGNGQFKEPQDVAVDKEGHVWAADAGNNRIQEFGQLPAGPHATQTIYYSARANPRYPGCGEHPEWANLPCQVQPAQQPTGGIGNLPVAAYTYNVWDEVEVTTQIANGATRTTTMAFDADGRPKASSISSTVGTGLPTVTDEYNEATGAVEKLSTTVEGKTKTITSALNKLGELESYTDADENTATFTYDIDGRPEKMNDGKGTQMFSYDTTTGYVSKLADSAAGTFTATRDIEGKLLSEGYPNGMSANYTYDATGQAIGLEYVKTTHCSEKCVWFSDSVVPSIYGQWLSQTSTLSSQGYRYDGAGRLSEVQDTPAGKGCTTRLYGYEEDTNRSSVTTREPGSEGKCATEGGSKETHTYDEADRLNDTGVAYDAFGDITKLPAADAGGSELTSSFYANNQLASQTQNGETIGYYPDPAGRTRETVATGKTSADVISHYAGGGGSPAWTVEEPSGHWTRNISGIEGSLVAIQTNGEAPVLQLANLHGDIIATASLSETETKLLSTNDTTEYGVPRTSTPPKYSWLGASERATELPSGVIAMGARSYVPQLGQFLQDDPIPGGSANAYAYTSGDPVNTSDPSGESTGTPPAWAIQAGAQVAEEAVARRAAEEAAARAEAERKVAEEEAAAAAYWAYWNSYSWVPTEAAGGTAEEGGGEEEGEDEGGGEPVAHAAATACGGAPDNPHKSRHDAHKGLNTVNVVFEVECSAPMAVLRARVALYWDHKYVAESGYVTVYGEGSVKANAVAPCRTGLYQAWVNASGRPAGAEVQVVNNSSSWGTPLYLRC